MSPILENTDSITFSVEVMTVKNGRKLGRVRPDEMGYYNNFPLSVIGAVSDNATYYTVDSFVNQIKDPKSSFNMLLTDGKLYGEYGHPPLEGLKDSEVYTRLARVAEERRSHHFKRIATGEKLESGGTLIVGDFKPMGPYGKDLNDELSEPLANTSFSLRSIVGQTINNGVKVRSMKKLVTFDTVFGGGYNQAAKRYCAGTEHLIDFTLNADINAGKFTEYACENFSDAELNEIFKSSNVQLHKRHVTYVKAKNGLHFRNDTEMRSAYYELMRNRD